MAKAKKGEIIKRGGKRIISDGKGGGRVVTAKDEARVRIKKATKAGKAPPIPGIVISRVPRSKKELRAARKKTRVKGSDAIKNEPTTRGIRKAFQIAQQSKKDAARKRKR